MSDGIKFGSIYVGHSLKEAKELADELWAPISKLEAVVAAKKMEEQAKAITSTWQDYLMTIVKQIVKQLDIFLIDVQEFIESVQLDPLEAIKEMPHVVITLLSLLALPTLFIGWMLSPSPKPRTANAAKSDKKAEKADKATKESVKAEKVKDSPSKAKKASAKAE